MSDFIKHECGIALLRLRKPIEYYQHKYKTVLYGINKMYLLMQKQHNRGQDGAGLASIKFDMPPGKPYLDRLRSNATQSIQDIFQKITTDYSNVYKENKRLLIDTDFVKSNIPFCGELLLGHLRYGTYGQNTIENCHPFVLENNWITRNLALAGNFNMTNVDELFDFLVDELGMFPKEKKDTVTILEKIGHFLNVENERIFKKYKKANKPNREISHLIGNELDIKNILQESVQKWDGGYVIGGIIGHGDAFVLRDPAGIRPAYYYIDDEIVVAASERPAIQTAFNVPFDAIKEIKPAHALIIKKNGETSCEKIQEPLEYKACSFERIYFSRGSDAEIYKERKELGRLLAPYLLEAVDYDVKNTIFSYIPNTAETCFLGMKEEMQTYLNELKFEQIKQENGKLNFDKLSDIMTQRLRIEKIAVKDAKLRTFITQDSDREDLVAHVYDVTYGVVKKDKDTLVVIDDSIVRGTTLKRSILKILGRLEPKCVIIVSSAPQIRYPDCYGIDMSRLGDFVAFRAAIELLKERHMDKIINAVYNKCKQQQNKPKEDIKNYVKEIYAPLTTDDISEKIAQLVMPENFKPELRIIYQSIENLHAAIPIHQGDWYFTGNYPTHGGNKVVNQAFINYVEKKNDRSY